MDCECEIGLSASDMASFRAMGVPPPTTVVYRPCQEEIQRGDYTWQRAGAATLDLSWKGQSLDERQVQALLRPLFATETAASVTAYVRGPVTNGWYGGRRKWRVFQVEVKRPNLSGEDGAPVDDLLSAYEDFVLHSTVLAETTGAGSSFA